MNTPFGTGIGNVFTPVLIRPRDTKIPVRLSKDHPDYEGFHEPFWVSPAELASQPHYESVHRFTGAQG